MNEEIDYGPKGYGCVTIAVSLIAIICSLFALATVDVAKCYKNSDCITITMLGTIVTFLVAWQIWQTIASREEIKDAREAANKIKTIEEKVDGIVPMTDAHFQFTLATALRTKGLDIPEVRSENFTGEEKEKMSQRALFSCMAFSQYLLTLQSYCEIAEQAKKYIAICLENIENMVMRMRGNYDLITKGLINIMISDLDSTLTKSGRFLTQPQIDMLTSLKQEINRNLSNGIDADAVLKERNKQRNKAFDNSDNTIISE